MEGEEESEQRKNLPKDDGTLALGIDFGSCRISSAVWNKNKKGTQLVKDQNKNDIYFDAFLSFEKDEIDYGMNTLNYGVDISSKYIDDEKKEEEKKEEEKKEEDYGIDRLNEGVDVVEVSNKQKDEGKKEEVYDDKPHIIKELKEFPSNPENVVYNIKQILGQKYNSDY